MDAFGTLYIFHHTSSIFSHRDPFYNVPFFIVDNLLTTASGNLPIFEVHHFPRYVFDF